MKNENNKSKHKIVWYIPKSKLQIPVLIKLFQVVSSFETENMEG